MRTPSPWQDVDHAAKPAFARGYDERRRLPPISVPNLARLQPRTAPPPERSRRAAGKSLSAVRLTLSIDLPSEHETAAAPAGESDMAVPPLPWPAPPLVGTLTEQVRHA